MAIAFNIDFSSDNSSIDPVPPPKRRGSSDPQPRNKSPTQYDSKISRDQSDSYLNIQNNPNGPKAKKGWGPPVIPGQLHFAKGVNANSRNQSPTLNEDISHVPRNAPYNDLNADQLDNDDREILKKLESKRMSQYQAREQAKEIFKKLREKKRKESKMNSKQGGNKHYTLIFSLSCLLID